MFIAITVKLIPEDVLAECRSEAEGMWSNGKPKKWYYAIPIILIWGLILWLVIRALWLRGMVNMINWIIGVVLFILVSLAVYSIIRQKKKGKGCIGCPDSGFCNRKDCHKNY